MQLDLSTADIRHIRWTLIQLYGSEAARPGPSFGGVIAIDDQLRHWIGNHSFSRGGGWDSFLTRELVDDLMARPFEPRPYPFAERTDLRASGDWASWREGDRCVVGTQATGIAEGMVFHLPEIHISTGSGGGGDGLWINLLTPNPFLAESWAEARVDGRRFALAQEEDQRWPAVTLPVGADGLVSPAVLRAMRAGSRMEVRGVSLEYGDVVAATFSLRGFTAAFTRMAELCRRPNLVGAWIR